MAGACLIFRPVHDSRPATRQHRLRPEPAGRLVPWICLILAAGVFLVFGQNVRHEFVNFDDEAYFTSNLHVENGLTWKNFLWSFQIGYAANWHPLTWLSLMLDVQLFGTGPLGPHLTNVILHAANTVLLFLLLRRLTRAFWPSALVAALFAIHPLHVESVAWASERKDVLSGFFFMLTLLMYARYAEPSELKKPRRGIFYGLSLIFFALGLMSKPMLVTLPFLLLLLDCWPRGRLQFPILGRSTVYWRLLLEKIPFLLLSAASCALTIVAQKQAITPAIELPISWRAGNAVVSYAAYLGQMFYPSGLAVFYPHLENGLSRWKIILSAIVVTGITLGALMFRRRHPYLLAGWLWYLGMLIPVIGLLQVGGQARADRYTYLPLIGVFIMIAWAAKDLSLARKSLQRAFVFVAPAILALLMVCSAVPASYWRNSETLWHHTLACTTRNYVAYSDLASVLATKGRNAEAIQDYQTALEINPRYAEAHNNIGIIFARQGDVAKAMEHYHTALDINPHYADAHVNLGNALATLGRNEEAIEQFKAALRLNEDNGEVYNDWGAVLQAEGKTTEALEDFQKAVILMPNNAEAQVNLGIALATEGHNDAALEHFDQALKLKPDNAKAQYDLANLLMNLGRLDEAVIHFERTVTLDPGFSHARYEYGLILQRQGNFTAAVEQFQEIVDRDPKHVAALNNLAWLLATCPENTVRNGNRAVEAGITAERLSGGKVPEILDTLAAAYAEAGNFSNAVATIKTAQALAASQHKDSMATSLQVRRMLYQSNLPFRDTSLAAPTKP